MSEPFGGDPADRPTLNPVVADGGRRIEAFVDIALFEDVPLGGGVAPDASVAIGLQFGAHRQRIGFRRIGLLEAAHARFGAEQQLHVMTDFVGEHVGLAKSPSAPKRCLSSS